MTHVIVKKGGDTKLGMVDAGEHINHWMITHGAGGANGYKDFFDDLWTNVEGSDGRQFFVKDSGDKLLSKVGNKYEYPGGELKPKPEKDFGNGNTKQMTVPIPEKNPDLVNSYVGTIANHVAQLSGAGAATDEAKQYLLAAIFLNRCQ